MMVLSLYTCQNGMNSIILNMVQFKKLCMFLLNMDCNTSTIKKNLLQSLFRNWLWYRVNALLTYLIAKEISELHVNYTGLEAYPVAIKEIEKLNFSEQLEIDKSIYTKLHTCAWEKKEAISNRFNLKKLNIRFEEFIGLGDFDLIYFDAFGPRVQPELWKAPIFEQMFAALKPNGVLVTYSAKGEVRRTLQKIGFTVERLPGPPGKREMLRGVKKI